ncbi:MAG: hypothetical protein WCQ21_13705, partial [Verrucomicrobiota bacterium]
AERLIGEELQRLGWTEGELAARRKSDPLQLALAARMRRETTLLLKAIACQNGDLRCPPRSEQCNFPA